MSSAPSKGQDVSPFQAHGSIGELEIERFRALTGRHGIYWIDMDAGDGNAGSIQCSERGTSKDERNTYKMLMNKHYTPAVRFLTLAHELGHFCLGHIGPDSNLRISSRVHLNHRQREFEAESVSYIVCARSGVTSNSENYLSNFIAESSTIDDSDIYQVMRAAGQVESLLGIGAHSSFKSPGRAIR